MSWPFGGGALTDLQCSNREDLLVTLSVFDDDTNSPVDMSGITLANPGTSFTAAAWTVTDGAIATTSATSITIPTYPVGNQLSALALTVGLGLGIAQGDPISIADTVTGLNVLTGTVASYSANTGALVVQIGWTFELEIRATGPKAIGNGYIDYWDYGTVSDCGPLISAQLGNGIEMTETGVLQILIPALTMQQLTGKTYRIAMTCTDGIATRQLVNAPLHMSYGGVNTLPVNATPSSWASIF